MTDALEEKFCEVSLVRSSRKFGSEGVATRSRKKDSENKKNVEKGTVAPSIFIADSSPLGNDEGMHGHRCTARRANASRGGGANRYRGGFSQDSANPTTLG
jgi:hypothetical protein